MNDGDKLLYHVSWDDNPILGEGLRLDMSDYGAIHFYPSLEDALGSPQAQQNWTSWEDGLEIHVPVVYQVEAAGLDLWDDPHCPGALCTLEDVAPERIRLTNSHWRPPGFHNLEAVRPGLWRGPSA